MNRRQQAIGAIIAILLITAGLAYLLLQYHPVSSGPLELSSNTFLQYSISGVDENVIVSSRFNYTIRDFGSISYGGNNYSRAVDFEYQARNIENLGSLMAIETINTSFGQKCVKTMIQYHKEMSGSANLPGLLIITNVGYDSLIVYRVVAARPGLHYTISLTETNNTDIPLVDVNFHKEIISGMSRIQTEPYVYGLGFGHGGGTYGCGSLEVLAGQKIHYEMTGEPVKFYFMSMNEINQIENGGGFTFVHSISLDYCTGEVDSLVAPGTYWWIVDFTVGSNEARLTTYWQI